MRSAVIKEKGKDKNVVICRLKKASKRFELSINKDLMPTKAEVKAEDAASVIKWDLVLSAPVIFTNATKSEAAKPQDLLLAFPKNKDSKSKEDVEVKSDQEIYVEILSKGEVLLSEEQRVEMGQKEKDHLSAVAAGIAERVHLRPTDEDEEGGKKKKKAKDGNAVRLGLFSPEDIERELKNAKFKPVSSVLSDQIVEGIAVLVHLVDLVRNQAAVTVVGDGAPDMKQVHAKFESIKPGYIRPLAFGGDKSKQFQVVYDPSCQEEVTKLATKLQCKTEGTITPFLPATPEEDLSYVKPEAALNQAKDQHTAKTSKKDKKKDAVAAGGTAEEKSQGNSSSKKKGSAVEEEGEAMSSLEAQLAALKADDSDDGGKKGKKGKKGKTGGNQPQPKKVQPPPQDKSKKRQNEFDSEEEESDEEEVEVQTMKPKKKR